MEQLMDHDPAEFGRVALQSAVQNQPPLPKKRSGMHF